MKIQFWICVNKKAGSVLLTSIAYYRKSCIEQAIGDSDYTWKDLRSFGWECVKKEITI